MEIDEDVVTHNVSDDVGKLEAEATKVFGVGPSSPQDCRLCNVRMATLALMDIGNRLTEMMQRYQETQGHASIYVRTNVFCADFNRYFAPAYNVWLVKLGDHDETKKLLPWSQRSAHDHLVCAHSHRGGKAPEVTNRECQFCGPKLHRYPNEGQYIRKTFVMVAACLRGGQTGAVISMVREFCDNFNTHLVRHHNEKLKLEAGLTEQQRCSEEVRQIASHEVTEHITSHNIGLYNITLRVEEMGHFYPGLPTPEQFAGIKRRNAVSLWGGSAPLTVLSPSVFSASRGEDVVSQADGEVVAHLVSLRRDMTSRGESPISVLHPQGEAIISQPAATTTLTRVFNGQPYSPLHSTTINLLPGLSVDTNVMPQFEHMNLDS